MLIDRLLEKLVNLAGSQGRVLLGFAVLSALFSCYALRVPFDLSFSGLMDREHPEVARYFAASKTYGLGGILPLLVEGPEERLDQAVAEVREALAQLPEVRSVDQTLAPEWVLAAAPWLVEPPDFDRWISAAHSSDAAGQAFEIDELLRPLQARLSPRAPHGARLVQIVMARDTFEVALDAEDFPTIRRVAFETLNAYGARGSFAGMPAIVTQEQEATLERMRLLGPLSLVLVLGILMLVERRWMILISIAIPMLLAVGCTLSLVGLIAGELSLMESVFGVLVFGLGIDFAVHLRFRVREERGLGRDFEESLRRAFLGTGRGVVAGGMTTAGAFFILALSPDPVFYRLGLSGGIGLTLCLAFFLVLLPAEWTWIEKHTRQHPLKRPYVDQLLLSRVAGACAKRPVRVLCMGGLLLVLGAAQMGSLSYETNLERVFSREIRAVETSRKIQLLFGAHPGIWLVPTKDLDEARATMSAFESEPLFDRAESAASWIPSASEATRRRAILETLVVHDGKGGDVLGTRRLPAELPGNSTGLDPRALLLAALAAGPPELASLPESIRERWVGPSGEILVMAYTREATLDSAIATEERRVAQAIHPSATSMSAIYEALIGTDRPWLPRVLVAVMLFITAIVRVDLGSFRLAALALVPASFSLVVTMGLLATVGFSLNTVTLVGIPLLLGLGVDDGIHVVHRMLEQPHASIEQVVGPVSRSIALTTVTTCGSVALLLFSRHPGIESVAILLLVGLPMALAATVMLIPALVAVCGVFGRD